MDQNEVKEVTQELIGWEGNKVFRTIKSLTVKPGVIIAEYGNGEKQKYLSPVVYLFGVVSCVFYLQSLLGLFDLVVNEELVAGYSKLFALMKISMSPTQIRKLFGLLSNQNLGIIAFLPFNLIITWFLYNKYNPSFKQNSWFVIYTTAQSSLFIMLPILSFWLFPLPVFAIISNLLSVLIFVYVTCASMQFYKLELGKAILLMFIRFLLLIPLAVLVYVGIFTYVYYFVV